MLAHHLLLWSGAPTKLPQPRRRCRAYPGTELMRIAYPELRPSAPHLRHRVVAIPTSRYTWEHSSSATPRVCLPPSPQDLLPCNPFQIAAMRECECRMSARRPEIPSLGLGLIGRFL